MQIMVIAVGHKMPSWIEDGFKEYTKRIPAEWRFSIKRLKPIERSKNRSAESVMVAEATRIRAAIPRNARLIALDEHGEELTTIALADNIKRWQQDSRDIAIIIGGADGLDPLLKKQSEQLIRLSSLTLPHGIVRVLLAEQLYRAYTILQNYPYHRN